MFGKNFILMTHTTRVMLINEKAEDQRCFYHIIKAVDASIELIQIQKGIDAIHYFNRKSFAVPDFIFVDVMLTGRNGFETLSILSKMPVLNHTTFFLCTDAEPYILEEIAQALGAKRCIKKEKNMDIIVPQLTRLFAENHFAIAKTGRI
jgi:CheY-like chemotaxis protein